MENNIPAPEEVKAQLEAAGDELAESFGVMRAGIAALIGLCIQKGLFTAEEFKAVVEPIKAEMIEQERKAMRGEE